MTNISGEVRDFLNKNPFAVKGLKEGIVNVRALAFYILKKTGSNASVHAVMSGIRRYEKEIISQNELQEDIDLVYSDSKISTKSRLVMITLTAKTRKKTLPAITKNRSKRTKMMQFTIYDSLTQIS